VKTGSFKSAFSCKIHYYFFRFFCFPLHIHDCRITCRWGCRWFCKSKHGQHFFLNVKKRMPSKIPSFSILPRLNCHRIFPVRQHFTGRMTMPRMFLGTWTCYFLDMSIINYQKPCNINVANKVPLFWETPSKLLSLVGFTCMGISFFLSMMFFPSFQMTKSSNVDNPGEPLERRSDHYQQMF
jgi:hypothetical protein